MTVINMKIDMQLLDTELGVREKGSGMDLLSITVSCPILMGSFLENFFKGRLDLIGILVSLN